MRALREIAHNVLQGKLPLTIKQLDKLKKHKKCLRLLAKKSTPEQTKLKIAQKGGFIGSLLAPLLAGVVGSSISGLTSALR